jgi:RNA-directed DNA polymerase
MSLQAPDKVRTLQRKLYQAAKDQPKRRFHQLYDHVYRTDILEHAYERARANGGAPGVDGVTFEDIEAEGLAEWLTRLGQELREERYEPAPVRRVLIPKAGGGTRPLGIPTIRDRVAQTAAKLVLEPIFEADFEASAHGYRPQRSAQDAVEEVHRGLCEGYTDVVDADVSKYFDTIPHDELMQAVARRVVDGRMLALVKAWLKTPVEERDDKGNTRMTGGKGSKMGTPQGGVISPLLANIYINRFLRAWRERGLDVRFRARIVNYADDFVVLSRGNAEEALKWCRWAMGNLGLTLNEAKTCIRNARKERFDFLGYTFGPERYRKTGQSYLAAQPSRKAVKRLNERVSAILRPGNQEPWPDVRDYLNQVLGGWANYFSYGTRLMAYRAIDHHVLDATRRFLRRRTKRTQPMGRAAAEDLVFGPLGVLRLRTLQLGPTPRAVR